MRARATAAVASCLLCLLAPPPRARADDWLAVLPSCGLPPPGALPRLELVYPRPGLPVLVRAGDMMVVRVRLSTPLTPPPGIQQPRALADWHATLTGAGIPFPRVEGAPPRPHHELSIVDVRPNDPQSLIYRASIPVPAWIAPGTYDLALSVPGGEVSVAGLVRVMRPDRQLQLAWLAGPPPGALPVDVWLSDTGGPAKAHPEDVLGGLAAPTLELRGLVAALRTGDTLRVLGDCEDRYLPYRDQVAAFMRRHPLKGASLEPPSRPPGPLAQQASVRIEYDAAGLTLALATAAGSARELAVLWSPAVGARVAAEGASVRWYPAAPLGAVPTPLLARVVLQPGGRLRLEPRRGPPLSARLVAQPQPVAAGQSVRIGLRGAPAGTRLALRTDERSTAFGLEDTRRSFRRPGLRPLLGLAIAADGRRAPLVGEVEVLTARATGCAVATMGP